MPEIGPTLREARMRARIDVSEIEAQTKIRAKYLRALENEEWSLLPGPTFVKSFLRTYAQALGLDGKALVEEYRLHHEGPGEGAMEPIVASSRGPRRRGPSGPGRGYMTAVGVIGAVIVLLIVLLVTGGSSSNSPTSTATGTAKRTSTQHTHHHAAGSGTVTASATPAIVTLSLRPTAAVYVCLVGDNARRLIPGQELQAGERTPTYRARRFEINLGNNSVTMYIDGRARTVPPSTEAIGYSITKARGRQPLPTGHLPTCK
jgi:cytoskeletal protein RodZ